MPGKIQAERHIRRLAIISLGLLALCFLVYFPQLNNSFFGDDYKYLGSDDAPQKADSFADYFRPDQYQHYNPYDRILNEFLFKHLPRIPLPFRLVNLTLFALTVISLLVLSYLLTSNQRIAFLTAALFCVHPLSAEMLNHVSFNTVFLFGLLLLLSFIAFLMHDKTRHMFWLILSLAFFINAQMCLEFYFILPVVLFLYLFMLRKQPFKRALLRTLPFLFLTLAHFSFWFSFIGHKVQFTDRMVGPHMDFATYLASFSYLANWFLCNIIIPNDIVFIYNIYPLNSGLLKYLFLLLFFLEIAVVLSLVFSWGKNIKSFCLLWFTAGFLPAFPASLIHIYMGMVFEPYWMYVPVMGLFLLLALLMGYDYPQPRMAPRTRNILILIIFLTLLLAGQYYIRAGKTERDYYQYWHEKSPHNYIALCGIAETYFKANEYDQALHYYYKAVATNIIPLRHPPYKAYLDIAQIHFQQRNFPQAKIFIQKIIEAAPQKPFPFFMLAMLAENENDFPQAEQYYLKAIQLAPSFSKASILLAGLYQRSGDFKAAESILQQVLPHTLTPNDRRKVLLKLTDLYIENKDYDRLVLLFEDLVQRRAPHEAYHMILNRINQKREYRWGLRIIERLFPALRNDIEFYSFKGIFQANLGLYEEAIKTWKQGLQMDSQDTRFENYIKTAEELMSERNQKNNDE